MRSGRGALECGLTTLPKSQQESGTVFFLRPEPDSLGRFPFLAGAPGRAILSQPLDAEPSQRSPESNPQQPATPSPGSFTARGLSATRTVQAGRWVQPYVHDRRAAADPM